MTPEELAEQETMLADGYNIVDLLSYIAMLKGALEHIARYSTEDIIKGTAMSALEALKYRPHQSGGAS